MLGAAAGAAVADRARAPTDRRVAVSPGTPGRERSVWGWGWADAGPGPEYERGIAHALEHLGPPLESWWRDLGNVTLNEELNAAIARGVTEELGGVDLARLTSQRDELLLALLQLKANEDRLP